MQVGTGVKPSNVLSMHKLSDDNSMCCVPAPQPVEPPVARARPRMWLSRRFGR